MGVLTLICLPCTTHTHTQIVDTNSLLPVDPRSPTAGITRTPFTVTTAPENIIPEIFIETVETAKELENLAQVCCTGLISRVLII